MSPQQSDLLINEIKKSGFLLECQVAQIFLNRGFQVEQNLLLKTLIPSPEFPKQLVEVDVFARELRTERPGDGYIVECKGAASADKLVLLPTSTRVHSLPSVYFKETVFMEGKENILCDNDSSDLPVYCHTGDFFAASQNGFKASKHEERNNLYRGIEQLYFAIDAAFLTYRGTPFRAFPVIVTNAEINVVKFNASPTSDAPVSTRVVPWAAYRNPMVYDSEASKIGRGLWLKNGDSDLGAYVNQKRIPVIWIVNVKNLESFITSPSKQYPQGTDGWNHSGSQNRT